MSLGNGFNRFINKNCIVAPQVCNYNPNHDSSTSVSCITDKPLGEKEKDDHLHAENYARALYNFIIAADTPVTIGIQGGWGSGKTSLISLLGNMLDEDNDHHALSVFVNAWEHSLFHGEDNKADVALSLLNGLGSGIKTSAEKSYKKSGWLDKETYTAIQKINDSTIDKAIFALKTALSMGAGLAASYLGVSLPNNKNEQEKNEVQIPPIAQSVSNLRSGLREIIAVLTGKGKPSKIVFFVDDLDRVPPSTAVEILDITKNIFDLENCVFVLAIDYDVIVKGLQSKFGVKTAENDREFRQYFDKIIQIPFTMPLGSYSDHIGELLENALARLNFSLAEDENSRKLLANLSEEARLATGGVPRSIKRILNTLSLLQYVAEVKHSDITNKNRLQELEIRFIIVALHINFPDICRRLTERKDYLQWSPDDLDVCWKLNWRDVQKELALLRHQEEFDEPWEQVVYCLCAKSAWLKTQAPNISRLLNKLRRALGGGRVSQC